MFAVITGSDYWKEIEETVKELDNDIIFKTIVQTDEEIDINSEMEQISRLPVKKIIIDYRLFKAAPKLVQAIRRLKIKKDNIQIILIAVGSLPGDPDISNLVGLAVYDIISEISEVNTLKEQINRIIERPASYSRAVRWDIGASFEEPKSSTAVVTKKENKEHVKEKIKEVTVTKIEERTVTITKEKILGTVVIGIVGAIKRIGATHVSISMGKFLTSRGFKVAVLELHPSSDFIKIKNAYKKIEEKEDYFILSDIHLYPYSQLLDVVNILQRDYQYIILDMGEYTECNLSEFHRSNKKIILSGGKDWEIEALDNILKVEDAEKSTYISKYSYCFNFIDKNTFSFIKDNMDKLLCYQIGYNPNPFGTEKKEKMFEILKDILPTEQAEKQKIIQRLLSKFKREE